MTGTIIDLQNWDRTEQFQLFRTYERPHFATTTRIDLSNLMARKADTDISPYRATLWAIGIATNAVPELRTRFSGDEVTLYDPVEMSFTIPLDNGSFSYGYIAPDPEFSRFDRACVDLISSVKANGGLGANTGQRSDLIYLSCMPWLDYTSIDNALAGPQDCIPRVSWGKIVPKGPGFDMAMTLQVHHAMVDGRPVGQWFAAVQDALNRL